MAFLPRFYFTLVTAIVCALASTWLQDALTVSILLTLILTGAVLADVVFIPRNALQVKRHAPGILRQAQTFLVELILYNPTDRAARYDVVDSPPVEFTGENKIFQLRLPAKQEVTQSYQFEKLSSGRIHVRARFPIASPGRWASSSGRKKSSCRSMSRSLPDLTGEGSRDLQLALAGAFQAGRRKSPLRGEGREFESLREHQRDDDFRHIDWKASAKRGKLISRQYETERDQRLMILLDTGRLMSPRIGPYRKLDYAINASIHLAQVALQKGDLVGYAIFNDELRAYAEPKKGQAQMSHLVKNLTALQPTRYESDYATVFHHVLKRCSRRTLIVCFTDLGDSHAAQTLLKAALPLRPRHLPVMITVSNSEVLAVTRKTPVSEFEVYQHVAAMEMWNDYQRTLVGLRSRGIAAVSVPAQDLSTATINEYLRIKESARL